VGTQQQPSFLFKLYVAPGNFRPACSLHPSGALALLVELLLDLKVDCLTIDARVVVIVKRKFALLRGVS
jgi:hypothetical protein